jgi:hypothetical protein
VRVERRLAGIDLVKVEPSCLVAWDHQLELQGSRLAVEAPPPVLQDARLDLLDGGRRYFERCDHRDFGHLNFPQRRLRPPAGDGFLSNAQRLNARASHLDSWLLQS